MRIFLKIAGRDCFPFRSDDGLMSFPGLIIPIVNLNDNVLGIAALPTILIYPHLRARAAFQSIAEGCYKVPGRCDQLCAGFAAPLDYRLFIFCTLHKTIAIEDLAIFHHKINGDCKAMSDDALSAANSIFRFQPFIEFLDER